MGDLLRRHGRIVGKVETGALGIHQAALLLHVAAQHFTQGFVHDVGYAVVAHSGHAYRLVHFRLYAIAYAQGALQLYAMMAIHIRLDFQGVGHLELHAVSTQPTLVTHLTTTFRIERGRIQHHHTLVASVQCRHSLAVYVQSQHRGRLCQMVIPSKGIALAFVDQRFAHFELTSGARCIFLVLHSDIKARFIHLYATLTAYVLGQIQRETIGIVQLERYVTWQRRLTICQSTVQNVHTFF